MDRRTLLALVLSIGIYYVWLAIRGPEIQAERDAEAAALAEQQISDSPPPPSAEPAPTDVVDVAGAPAVVAHDEKQLDFQFCNTEGTFSTVSGLHGLRLDDHQGPFDVQPLYSWIWALVSGQSPGSWHPWGETDPGPAEVLTPDSRALLVGAGHGPASDPPLHMRAVLPPTDQQMVLEGVTADGVVVRQSMKPSSSGTQCVIDMEVTWTNQSTRTFDRDLWVSAHDVPSGGAGGMTARYSSQRQPTAVTDGDLNYGGPTAAGCVSSGTRLGDEPEERRFELEGDVSWFGISDRYFGMYLVPRSSSDGVAVLSRIGTVEGGDALDGVHLAARPALAPGASHTEHFSVFVGPNDMAALEEVHEDLSSVVDLGWFAFFGYPLLWMMRLFYSAVGNWGLAIVMTTLVIKIVFFPMTQRSFRSMQKTQKIQPRLNEIREEYADRPQEMNKKLFEVMQEEGVNPAAGCLPMLVQFPVWIALYNVLLTSVDLYHTEFLYLNDLTQPDPYLVLPTIIMGLMFLQQQFTTPSANMDPAQQQVMRLMPLFFGLLFFAFPSGLAVYVFVNMVLSILQQWLIKRSLDNEGPGTPAGAAAPA